MKKLILLLTCVTMSLHLQAQAEQKPNTQKNESAAQVAAENKPTTPSVSTTQKKEFRKLTTDELAAQYTACCLFGSLTGAGCHFAEKSQILEWPWSWMLEFTLREGVLRTVDEDMQNNRAVALTPGAIKVAWASSWIAYVAARYAFARS